MRGILNLISDGFIAVSAILYAAYMLHVVNPTLYHKLMDRLRDAWEQAKEEYGRVFGLLQPPTDDWDWILNEL